MKNIILAVLILCLLFLLACGDINELQEKQSAATAEAQTTEPQTKVTRTTEVQTTEAPMEAFIRRYVEIALAEPRNPQRADGYTKYGEYFGDADAQWCTEFAVWCICKADEAFGTDYAGTLLPKKTSAYSCVLWHKENGSFRFAGEYTPRMGDLIYFDYDGDGNCDHTGIVTGTESGFVLTVEGNLPEDYPNGVIRERRLPEDNPIIYGYGVAPR